MAVPSVMAELSTTAASNSPAGTESPSNADDFLRAIQAIVRTTNAKGSDIASATTTDIGAATGEFVDVTGTTTITALGTIAAGIVRTVRFTGALTLTHNATSLILPGSANITTANGDVAQFRSLGSGNWKCVGYIRQDGSPISLASASVVQSNLAAALRLQFNLIQDFRLTLTSGTPVTTTDVTGATTIYCTPYKGNAIALYDGTNWNLRTSAQFSLALGTLTSGLPYDVFCYDNAGTPTLEFTAWTNDTTRATALTYQDGVLVKTAALTRRYIGTFYTTSTTQTEDSKANRYLWNYYHRVLASMERFEDTNTWNYTTATIRQANGSTLNQLNYVCGVAEDAVEAHISCAASNTALCQLAVGVGVDSTTAFSGIYPLNSVVVANTTSAVHAHYNGIPGAGRRYLAWLEYSQATGTTTWRGDNNTPTIVQSGIIGSVWK
jgi:hypothetical protein